MRLRALHWIMCLAAGEPIFSRSFFLKMPLCFQTSTSATWCQICARTASASTPLDLSAATATSATKRTSQRRPVLVWLISVLFYLMQFDYILINTTLTVYGKPLTWIDSVTTLNSPQVRFDVFSIPHSSINSDTVIIIINGGNTEYLCFGIKWSHWQILNTSHQQLQSRNKRLVLKNPIFGQTLSHTFPAASPLTRLVLCFPVCIFQIWMSAPSLRNPVTSCVKTPRAATSAPAPEDTPCSQMERPAKVGGLWI